MASPQGSLPAHLTHPKEYQLKCHDEKENPLLSKRPGYVERVSTQSPSRLISALTPLRKLSRRNSLLLRIASTPITRGWPNSIMSKTTLTTPSANWFSGTDAFSLPAKPHSAPTAVSMNCLAARARATANARRGDPRRASPPAPRHQRASPQPNL